MFYPKETDAFDKLTALKEYSPAKEIFEQAQFFF